MKKFRAAFLILLTLLLLTSCVSTAPEAEVTPLSLYSKRKFSSSNQVFFVGEGQSDNVRQAELLSFMDLNDKVYRYLGIDSEPESYKELSTEGTIARYGLKIQENSTFYLDGKFTYALVASADLSLLEKDRSLDMQKEEEIAQQAVNMVLQGDEYIKANNDLEGLRCYLKSLPLSYGLRYIDDEFSFSTILEEILDIFDALEIRIYNIDSEKATCKVKLTRHDTIIPSKVKDSVLKATFPAEDSRGRIFTDSYTYTTDSRGIIDFVPRAYNTANSGTISFTFDYDDEIREIEKLSPSTADAIKNAIEEKTASFGYNRNGKKNKIVICVQCVNSLGETEIETPYDDYLVDKYAQNGIEAFALEYEEDDTVEALIGRIKNTGSDTDGLIVIRVGVSDVFETRIDICSVSVEGSVEVYDLNSGLCIYDSEITYANGFGSTVADAQNDAFTNFVLMMFTLLKGYYV